MSRGFSAIACAAVLIGSPALANNCQTAALNYYCMAVTLALAQGSSGALSLALATKAASLGDEAKKLGFDNLKDRYSRAGLDDVAKSGKDPKMLDRIMGTCVSPKQKLIETFRESASSDCTDVRKSYRQKSSRQETLQDEPSR